MSSNSSEHRQLSIAYFLCFVTLGLYLPYFPSYLRARGLSGVEIGWLLSLSPLMRTVIPPLLGILADRVRGPRFWGMVSSWGAALGLVVITLGDNYLFLLAGMICFFIFNAPAITLLDAATVLYLKRSASKFGHVRLWGSAGFILTSLGLGTLYPQLPAIVIIGAMVGSGLLFAIFISAARMEEGAPQRPEWHELPRLARNRQLLLLLFALFINRIASAPYNGFFTIFVQELALGGEIVALNWGLAVAIEIIVMLIVDRCIDRFGFGSVLAFGILSEALRWFVYTTFTNKLVLLAVAPGHGIAFATIYVSTVRGVNKIVPIQLASLGQGLAAAATGLGTVLGLIAAGYLKQSSGSKTMFFAAGILALINFVIALPLAIKSFTTESRRSLW